MAKIKRSPSPEGNEPPAAADSQTFFPDDDAPDARPSIYDMVEGSVPEEEGHTVIYDTAPAPAGPDEEGRTMIYDPTDEPDEPGPAKRRIPRRGWLLLAAQAALSAGALFQLYRTQMLPTLFLAVAGAALALLLALVFCGQQIGRAHV